MLGEDRINYKNQLKPEKMKIAFTTKGTSLQSDMDPRFGRTDYLLFIEHESGKFSFLDNREIESVEHGAGTKTSSRLIAHQPDVLITGNGPGGNASTVLQQTGIKIFTGAENMTVKEAYDAWRNNMLKEFKF